MILNKKGSLYELAKFGNENKDFTESDLCTVTRRIFWGLLFSIFIIVFGSFILSIILYLPFYGILYAITGEAFMTVPLIFIGIIVFIVCIISFFRYSYLGLKYIKNETAHKLEGVEYVQTVYTDFKEKICTLVEVK